LASAPRGLADLLARELVAFGAADARERSTGVSFSGSLAVAYRTCLWSRVANRVFLELGRFDVADAEAFYRAVRSIDWSQHLGPEATLACDFSGHHPSITHTHFGALKLKDAIVDSMRESHAWRPSVELDRPSVRVHAHANGTQVTVSLDLAGESLHRRGYRGAAGEAPLKENVAAGVLMRSGWPELAAQGVPFLDPMCGSGTFVIEAALIAADRAPGLDREYFGFLGWAGHDAELWRQVLDDARSRARAGLSDALSRGLRGALRGQDRDPTAVRNARGNADRAGMRDLVGFDVRSLKDAAPVPRTSPHDGGEHDAVEGAAQVDDGFADAEQPDEPAHDAAGDVSRVGAGFTASSAPGDPEQSDDDAPPSGAARIWAEAAARKGFAGAARAQESFATREPNRAAGVGAGDLAPAAESAGTSGADHAGGDLVRVAPGAGEDAAPVSRGAEAAGLVCTNPPYGVRLEDRETAKAVHRELGEVLRERFQGWNAAVLTGSPEFGLELGIRAHRTHTVWNGAIECRLLRMKIDTGSAREPGRLGKGEVVDLRNTPGAQMFANRLAKNLKKQQPWADRSGIFCYRLYDADMPEYAFAIDVYRTLAEASSADAAGPRAPTRGSLAPTPAGASSAAPVHRSTSQSSAAGAETLTWLYVQEYAAPSEIELEAVRRRRGEALSTLADVTGVDPDRIRIRTRRKTKRGDQYSKVQDRSDYHVVLEDGLKFLVNFDDYLDTGLFLDHRKTRARLRAAAAGKRFLNLFAYTCTASVYAAAGGAASTTSVDMSNTYLNWAQRNFELNGLGPDRNGLVQADCRVWLEDTAARSRERYDLVFIDPPTFSNSKRMEGVLDVDRDHPILIDGCARLLAPGGLIVFSTNSQRFRLDESMTRRYDVVDISTKTLPHDFERNPRIHRCFEVRAKA
jgi:23S rRNA G2445 N2-methylase RlmL/23S rRNA G2069 N7-methylase RlmK/C1962 C5-methylase RlmI